MLSPRTSSEFARFSAGEDSILSPRMTAGVGMAVLGFVGYSHVKVNQFQRLADISRAVSSDNREKLLV